MLLYVSMLLPASMLLTVPMLHPLRAPKRPQNATSKQHVLLLRHV